jgi:hypothetical protein
MPPCCLFNSVAKFVTKEEKMCLTPDNLKKEVYYMEFDQYHKTDLVAHVAGTFLINVSIVGYMVSFEISPYKRLIYCLFGRH